ncbi:MAG TPA: trigger factor [Gemmatimonadaceae bacterium]|jgi:trigger factor|nr:trigger factor [Gemmatimonadaceae bacterium]
MDIQITTKKSDGVERLLAVSVPADAVRDAEAKTARRYASSVRLPGFRPGKAPAALVQKRFKDAIRQEVIERLVQEAFQQVMDKEQLKVASQPHIHDLKFEDGQPMTFELHLEVRPEITLARVDGFSVQRPSTPITDEAVAEQLEQLREQRATWTPVLEKPMPGDQVRVLLATAEDGSEIPEGREYTIELGAGQAIAGVEELIMELSPSQSAERPVRWPDDFPDESQRGKTKPVRVELQDVKRKSLPALDDAFAREVGDFESLEALRTAVRTDLEEHAKREADAAVRQQLIDQVVAANPFDVPPSWVRQMIEAYLQVYQVPEDEKERFAGEFAPVAERQVRRDLVIDTLAEREKLAASEADVDDRVAEVAKNRGVEPGQVYASLQKAGRLKEIERSITEDKVFAWLLERNTVA